MLTELWKANYWPCFSEQICADNIQPCTIPCESCLLQNVLDSNHLADTPWSILLSQVLTIILSQSFQIWPAVWMPIHDQPNETNPSHSLQKGLRNTTVSYAMQKEADGESWSFAKLRYRPSFLPSSIFWVSLNASWTRESQCVWLVIILKLMESFGLYDFPYDR